MDFKLASTPKNKTKQNKTVSTIYHLGDNQISLFISKDYFVSCKICVTNCFPRDKNYGNSGLNYYTIMLFY